MHAVLTLTLMHDRSLSAPNSKLSATEAFHWYQSTAQFNSKISKPIEPSERDALWATTVLLAIIAFYRVDAKTPEEAWPLKPASPLDLNWLWLSNGKSEVWKLSQPWRNDSVWQVSARHYLELLEAPQTVNGLGALPSELIKLCGLEDTSATHENPYHAAATSVAESMTLDSMIVVNMAFLGFTMNMAPEFKRLLRQKDPCALLLLAYWYAKLCQYPLWWIHGRTAVELRAICIYLDRRHPHNTYVQKLLIWPKTIGGIAVPRPAKYLTNQ